VVARPQLESLGLGRGAIDHDLAVGRLHAIHAGVYAVGHDRVGGHGRWMAAVLASGDGALLSHLSAAALWGFLQTARARIDVTAPGRTRGSRAGITVHRPRRLDPDDRAERDAIPVTSVARTLLDLAEVVAGRRLERAFEDAERLRLLDLGAIERLCRRSAGRRGLKPVRELLSRLQPAPEVRSELERRFVAFCRRAGLPPPVMNPYVAGFEVDALWAHDRLIVELDGYAFHGTRVAFERDRAKDAKLQVAGYRVLRLTDRRLREEPASVADLIRSLLEQSLR
jgi:hypothetical protein